MGPRNLWLSSNIKGLQQVYSVYLSLKGFKKPEDKDYEQTEQKSPGVMARQVNQGKDCPRGQGLQAAPLVWNTRPYTHRWATWPGGGEETFLEILDIEPRSLDCKTYWSSFNGAKVKGEKMEMQQLMELR